MNYYAFEGVDMLGKSTQIELLKNTLKDFRFVKEPGASELGIKLRELILNHKMSAKARMFLFLADRAELFASFDFASEKIISDRSLISHLAYEISSDYQKLLDFNLFATNEILPNHIIFFKGDAELLQSRMQTKTLDEIEQKGIEYFLKVQENYEKIIKELKLDHIVINAELDIYAQHKIIKEYINDTSN